MSAGNDDLHPLLRRVSEQITDIKVALDEIREEKFEKVIEVLRSGFEEVTDAINRNIQAQAEMKMVEYMMKVEEVEPQIEAEHERLKEEREDLKARLEKIDERYQKRHDDLDQKANERIRDLGEHIFALEEEEFNLGVEGPFVEHVTPTWGALRGHNAVEMADRQDRVRETASRTVYEVAEFVDRQDALIDEVDDHRLGASPLVLDDDEPEPIQMPYYVVHYEVDGRTERELVVPSETCHADGEDSRLSARLEPLEGVEHLLGVTGAGPDVHEGREQFAASRESIPGAAIADRLREYDRPSLGLSYADALGETVGESLKIRAKGGDR